MIQNVEHMLNQGRHNMPGMPRIKGKPTRIAYSVLGIPANMLFKKTPKQERINKRLMFDETIRAK